MTSWGHDAVLARRPDQELREAVGDALAAEEPLELVAGGAKRGLGRPMQTPRTLDLSGSPASATTSRTSWC